MSRPNLLFLATPGELSVYDLTQPPPRTAQEWKKRKPLDAVCNVADVATALNAYHRQQIESGRLFEEKHFGDFKRRRRADRSLIMDLRIVREELMKKGLKGKNLKYAHALIGRSIFIRYLEDRGILTRKYFLNVAGNKKAWLSILDSEPDKAYAEPYMGKIYYLKVLSDNDFTYTLFHQLAQDFNGDMFPEDQDERRTVKQEHLDLLQSFLRGDTGLQRKLFFWAYKFDIIPIELISSIYEEFYSVQNGERKSTGTHYTPSALVDFLLSQTLTTERLANNPRILDAACGSGIFLVESFRRIARYRVHQQNGRRLDARQLRKILRDQIRGIDINEEAIRISAFSLYLALLHYQEPPDILAQMDRGYCLPRLIKGNEQNAKSESFDILLAANAFSKEADTTADIVVGNPPWGDAPKKDKEAREQTKEALDWCNEKGYPVGDRERSQAFIWRACDFLRENGTAGLLVSTGIFHKHGSPSKAFRKKWLDYVILSKIIHFGHVRHIFFPESDSPFASVIFEKSRTHKSNNRFMYGSARKTAIVNSLQSVILSHEDINFLEQSDIIRDHLLWKMLWWGNHQDAALINALRLNDSFSKLVDDKSSGRGYERSGPKKDSDWLKNYQELPLKSFIRYGNLSLDDLKIVPDQVYRRGIEDFYCGERLLVKRGITERGKPKGRIIARLEQEPFCFSSAIFCFNLTKPETSIYKILLGIIWSSLARYYFFLTASSWGPWHNELHKEEILEMPVRLPKSKNLKKRIINIVDQLRNWPTNKPRDDSLEFLQIESELDEAIFDLYELSEPERDLVCDMCDVGLVFFYDPVNSSAARSVDLASLSTRMGKMDDLKDDPKNRVDIQGYLRAFLHIWNRELKPDGEFVWRVISPSHDSPMLAVVFSAQAKEGSIKAGEESDDRAWLGLLKKLGRDLQIPFHSERIYIDGLVRVVTPTEIIIIKRNEGRFWTRSMAREDAEATLLKAMNLDSDKSKGLK